MALDPDSIGPENAAGKVLQHTWYNGVMSKGPGLVSMVLHHSDVTPEPT